MKHDLIQFPHRTRPEVYRQPVTLTRAELEYYSRRAHALRSEAFSRLFKGAAAGLGRGVRALYRALKESRDRRRAIAELRQLDERTLKDIGIERGQIPQIVEALLAKREAEKAPRKAYPLRALTTAVTARRSVGNGECCPPLAA
ncbi:MAG: DUF1127 domain-containing protein [Gammaproteobacteria bacterium]|nr:DUF1127 domain-containing protein [Gammaproteobacteria bacterium]